MGRRMLATVLALTIGLGILPCVALAATPEEELDTLTKEVESSAIANYELAEQEIGVVNIGGIYNGTIPIGNWTGSGYNSTVSGGDSNVISGNSTGFINRLSLTDLIRHASIPKVTYTGKQLTPEPKLSLFSVDKTLVKGVDYTVEYKNNINPGTATATITGIGSYAGTIDVPFEIAKANNAITKVTKKKTIRYKKLAKKKQSFKIAATAKGNAKLTFKKKSVSKKAKKYIKVSSSGKVTVKKGLKKGTYKLKVKITAAETTLYKQATTTKTITIRVK